MDAAWQVHGGYRECGCSLAGARRVQGVWMQPGMWGTAATPLCVPDLLLLLYPCVPDLLLLLLQAAEAALNDRSVRFGDLLALRRRVLRLGRAQGAEDR